MFMAIIVVALAVLFTSATGNLFYFVMLLLVAIGMVLFSRLAR